MNLAIDIGNTKIKAGVFNEGHLLHKETFEDIQKIGFLINKFNIKKAISASVRKSASINLPQSIQHIYLSHQLKFPFKIHYKTPETLGTDRIAAVAGALAYAPNRNILVIDAGTCITYDFIDADRNYLGGNISPGINMRFKALHNFTDGLPLLSNNENALLIGQTTEEAISGGVLNGTIFEVAGIINEYHSKFHDVQIIMTGGDAHFFENKLKETIFAVPDLLLSGLNSILKYNA
ncbi:type III pantothenate kinase [Cytophagaceae bacterium ABcell3]|nr:type III pantothenate kinase [Cytophagaceae bacterium ABcell3]